MVNIGRADGACLRWLLGPVADQNRAALDECTETQENGQQIDQPANHRNEIEEREENKAEGQYCQVFQAGIRRTQKAPETRHDTA